MPDEPSFTITVTRRGDEFRAELDAPSGINGVADLHLRGIGRTAREAVLVSLTELESKAADNDSIALRFD